LPEGLNGGNSDLIFRVSDASDGTDSYRGYYAGLDVGTDNVVLGIANNNWRQISLAPFKVKGGGTWHIRIRAEAEAISVFVDDMTTAKITVKDKTYSKGGAGVHVHWADTTFDNVDIKLLS
jgi:hypothetical protein